MNEREVLCYIAGILANAGTPISDHGSARVMFYTGQVEEMVKRINDVLGTTKQATNV